MGALIQYAFALYWGWRYGREERREHREQRARTQHTVKGARE